MTDRRSAGLSEFTWYSRLAAWIGAAMLLVQSVLGRDAGPVTVLAVLLLGIGFLCFLVGLAVDSRVPGTELLIGPGYNQHDAQDVLDEQEGTATEAHQTSEPADGAASHAAAPDSQERQKTNGRRAKFENSPAVSRPARRPKFRERAKRADTRPAEHLETGSEFARPTEGESEQAGTPVKTSSGPVRTENVAAASPVVGAKCPHCENPLQVDQLAATCPICGRTHHAVCWMEHQFHCATVGCPGQGSLEAPAPTPAQDEAEST